MARFLCFRLHGPLAAWGDVAVGQIRPTSAHPSRSAVLGLVAACAGIRRTQADDLARLDAGFGLASRTDAAGELLIDFHTAQGPAEKHLRDQARAAKKRREPWHRPATREAELSGGRHDLETLLSYRQYRVDAAWTVALWAHEAKVAALPSLDELAEALRRPVFLPYLGRKSCVLDLPFEPQLVEAHDPVHAMAAARFSANDLLAPLLAAGSQSVQVQWEGDWAGLTPQATVRRRDRVLSRARWQFVERSEHNGIWAVGGPNDSQ